MSEEPKRDDELKRDDEEIVVIRSDGTLECRDPERVQEFLAALQVLRKEV